MEVNWLDLLNGIQDLREALEVWGITYPVLIAIGLVALALFVISLREIAVWYLRISDLQAQLRLVHEQLAELKKSVERQQAQAATVLEPPTGAPKKFHLDH